MLLTKIIKANIVTTTFDQVVLKLVSHVKTIITTAIIETHHKLGWSDLHIFSFFSILFASKSLKGCSEIYTPFMILL
jgi:hypothetical protein